jgi:hypothetical protein
MYRRGWMTAQECLPWPSGAQALLLQAAIAPDEDVIPAFLAWQKLVDLDDHIDGGSFRLLPMVYDRLRRLGSTDPLMGRLKGVYRKAWSEMQTLLHATAPALAALHDAGVPTMLIKGAPLALSIYPSVAARPMMDLDIVVRKPDVAKAKQVLHTCGWLDTTRLPPEEMPEAHSAELHNAGSHDIDLHWHPLRDTPARVADEWFWHGAEPLDFVGTPTLQPRPTAQLLHTVIHGLRSNPEPPVRWIADAMTILRAKGDTIDWQDLTSFTAQQKLSYRLHLGLSFLATHYRAPIPQAVLARLQRDGISLVERVENIVYLGNAEQMYRPFLYPLIDYCRYSRNMPLGAFLRGYAECLQRRWRLGHPAQIPLAATAVIGRNAAKLLARGAPAR